MPARRLVPTRWVGEQHVEEGLGFIPSFADWVKAIRPEPWMDRGLRIEAEVDPRPEATVARAATFRIVRISEDIAGPDAVPFLMLTLPRHREEEDSRDEIEPVRSKRERRAGSVRSALQRSRS